MTKENNWLPTQKDIEDYKLLKDILKAQRSEFDILSNKKADVQLNALKIKIVNRVLEPLKKLCKHEQSHKFLDILVEDDMPTNSDVVLIISQYETAISEFRDNHFKRDEYKHSSTGYRNVDRWMTKEFPPDFYSGEEDYGDEIE